MKIQKKLDDYIVDDDDGEVEEIKPKRASKRVRARIGKSIPTRDDEESTEATEEEDGDHDDNDDDDEINNVEPADEASKKKRKKKGKRVVKKNPLPQSSTFAGNRAATSDNIASNPSAPGNNNNNSSILDFDTTFFDFSLIDFSHLQTLEFEDLCRGWLAYMYFFFKSPDTKTHTYIRFPMNSEQNSKNFEIIQSTPKFVPLRI